MKMLKFFKDKTSKSNTDKGFKFRADVILRFNLLVIFLFTTIGIFIIGKAAIIMFVERDYWNEIKEKIAPQIVSVPAHRGNILADDGELIVSTLPSYKIHIDFVYVNKDDPEDEEHTRLRRDTLWTTELKPLCAGLHEIFPEKSAEKFEKDLSDGYRNKRRYHWLYERRISYMQYRRLLELPIIKEGKKYSGIIVDEEMQRKNILGNTGNGTFGVIREVELVDSAKNVRTITEVNGLEQKYHDYLKGEPGRGTKTSLRGKIVTEVQKQPVNGYDIQTTLNTRMMDICHTALERVLREKELAAGWAILMETKTGDIKAIVNLSRVEKGKYVDTIANLKYNQTANHALCDLNEPGCADRNTCRRQTDHRGFGKGIREQDMQVQRSKQTDKGRHVPRQRHGQIQYERCNDVLIEHQPHTVHTRCIRKEPRGVHQHLAAFRPDRELRDYLQ